MYAQVQFQNTSVGTPNASAIGENTTANGDFSFVGGFNSSANANFSFIYGNNNSALNYFSIVFGENCISNGDYSLLFGTSITTAGAYSFSFGNNIINNANNSYLLGTEIENTTLAVNSFVLGSGLSGNRLINNQANSLMIGFNSNLPTLFVSSATGVNTTGNLGIATTTPGSKLQVNGNVAIGYSSATTSPTNGLVISGNLGVGTNNPSTKLQVNGNAAIGYNSAPSNGLAVNGNVGIGVFDPLPKTQINGNIAIGYSTALYDVPLNGAIINGDVGVGVADNHAPYGKLEVVQSNNTIPNIVINVLHEPSTPIIRITTNQNIGNSSTNPYPFLDLLEITTGSQLINGTYPANPHTIDFKLKNGTTMLITGGGLMIGYNDDYSNSNNMPTGQYAPSDGLMVKGDVSIGMEPKAGKTLSVDGDIYSKGDLNLGDNDFSILKGSPYLHGITYDYTNSQDPSSPLFGRKEYNFKYSQSGAFNFYKSEEDYLFTITTTGEVGINQPDPQATLHIVEEDFDADPSKCTDALRIDAGPSTNQHTHFLVKSNGFVYAREINVLLGPIPPPDYVFSNNYRLKSLEEVDQYISRNNHLPEVPSAEEMTENGVDLGEMNMILLKKIEELTLHMIELNKRIKELEEKKETNSSNVFGN